MKKIIRRRKSVKPSPWRILWNDIRLFGRSFREIGSFFVKAPSHFVLACFPKSKAANHPHAHLVLYTVGGVSVILCAIYAEHYVGHTLVGHTGVEVAKAAGACPLWEVVQKGLNYFKPEA